MSVEPQKPSFDITEAELRAILDQIDREIAAQGLPSLAQIRGEISALHTAQDHGSI